MSSLGLSSRTAAVLAYSGWWVTGAIVWFLERRNPRARFHAAQAIVVFGLIALLIVLFGVLAVASLSFLPSTFGFFITAAMVTWTAGVLLWGVTMWKVASGDEWKIPVAAGWVDRLSAWRATSLEPASA
jgi:uncharacterized membrane protein